MKEYILYDFINLKVLNTKKPNHRDKKQVSGHLGWRLRGADQ